MKGSEKVTSKLQELLSYELASIHQYFIHSEIYEDMGLTDLYLRIHHEMEEEQGHAQLLIRRLLFLEKTPNVEKMSSLMVGSGVREMLENDLKLELAGREIIIQGITICEEEGDFESREILGKLLDDTEEDHIYWLERQLKLIDMIGLPNYLQKRMGKGEG
jgi:bacterioferritin